MNRCLSVARGYLLAPSAGNYTIGTAKYLSDFSS
jgi:hypothetical protein